MAITPSSARRERLCPRSAASSGHRDLAIRNNALTEYASCVRCGFLVWCKLHASCHPPLHASRHPPSQLPIATAASSDSRFFGANSPMISRARAGTWVQGVPESRLAPFRTGLGAVIGGLCWCRSPTRGYSSDQRGGASPLRLRQISFHTRSCKRFSCGPGSSFFCVFNIPSTDFRRKFLNDDSRARTHVCSRSVGSRRLPAPSCARSWASARPSRSFPTAATGRNHSTSASLYKLRWRIENAFNRLKDCRRIATRYDRLARNYLASVCLAAALVWWI
jgi:transposase